jgi:hypothetical protein
LYYDYDLDQWSTTWGDLERYIDDRGYDFKRNGELFFEKWDDLKRTLDKKEPVIVLLNNGNDFGHAVVGRGYWKDNRVLCSMGWGSDRAETVKGDKMTNMPFKWGEKATFTRVVKDEIQNFLEVEITGVVYFEPE